MDPKKEQTGRFNADAPAFQPGLLGQQQQQYSYNTQQQMPSTRNTDGSYFYQQQGVYGEEGYNQSSGYSRGFYQDSCRPGFRQNQQYEQYSNSQQQQQHPNGGYRVPHQQQQQHPNGGYRVPHQQHQYYGNQDYGQPLQQRTNNDQHQESDWHHRRELNVNSNPTVMTSQNDRTELSENPRLQQQIRSPTSTQAQQSVNSSRPDLPETEKTAVVLRDDEKIKCPKKLDKVESDWEGVGSDALNSTSEVVESQEEKEKEVFASELCNSDPSIIGDATDLITGEKTVSEIEELKGKYAKLKEPDSRPHLNVVFIGHVDAGKSTTCGNILFLTGQVDQRTIEKYEREAKDKNRDTWFFAFITDINEEERQKGKTVEVGRAAFELENTRFTILDAPGHKSFVPNMIGGAAQADVAVLIISARKGEFETGFERGGQTREHAMLAKTLGVSQLVVAVNKMDDTTCNWSEERYREIEKKLTPFLKGCGYNPAKDIFFVPISGLSGQNLKLHAADPSFKQAAEASWYDKSKPTLFTILDRLQPPERNEKDPLRIPLLEGFRDQGVMAVGKVEAGTVVAGQMALLMPKRLKIQIAGVQINDEDVSRAKPGENVTLKIIGVEEDQITKGMVLCSISNPCPIVTTFRAQVMIVELLDHRPLITVGYSCIIHAHTACEEVQLVKLLEVIDKATKKKKVNPQFVKGNSLVVCEMQTVLPICVEAFDERPQLGRFTLRDEGKTIAIGKILEILG